MLRYINPLDFGKQLLEVEKPVRYVGGEYGILAKKDAVLQTLIAFPDLYEIGMSNQALRIIYNRLNGIEGVSCDRAFMPAPDFRAFLKEQSIPLYGLDTGIALGGVDILMFTLGYELGITNVLAMLDLAGIPLHAKDRTAENSTFPIVIMGGPCVSNPLPYAHFVDAFWIGEAEAGFFDLMDEARSLKATGKGRVEILELIISHNSVWSKEKSAIKKNGVLAVKAIDMEFASRRMPPAVFPVPNMKVVQNHGSVEIMRGCPNGCRFCHAGYWYRPMRQKPADVIEQEAGAFIQEGGYHEISLSSLSSGDYNGIESLIDRLNAAYKEKYVSFQLPSLRVSTFSLPLLDKISQVRKSGLTFAVETPVDAWQMMINKEVSRENVVTILLEAKKHGWRSAKFYFMVGLPVVNQENNSKNQEYAEEEIEIVNFVLDVARRTGLHFNVNVGTFIPKPHTPFQKAAQLDEENAQRKFDYIKSKLKPLGHKVGIQDPFVSTLEGIISRGDEQMGVVIEEAFQKGCCLDAWTEFFNKDIWRSLIENHKTLIMETLGKKGEDMPLPWENIGTGMSKTYLNEELSRSNNQEFTSICMEKCIHPCGICNNKQNIVKNIIQYNTISNPVQSQTLMPDQPTWRIIFAFSKEQEAVFYSHLSLIEILAMSFLRADIPVEYSRGFNPLPKLEIAAPLSIGITGTREIGGIETRISYNPLDFIHKMNKKLPKGLKIRDAIAVFIPVGEKKHSLSSLLWGYEYKNNGSIDTIPASEEKTYRYERTKGESIYGLERVSVLARSTGTTETGISFFEVYKKLYSIEI